MVLERANLGLFIDAGIVVNEKMKEKQSKNQVIMVELSTPPEPPDASPPNVKGLANTIKGLAT